MKRLSLGGITMMVILLGFAPMGWAQEASVFDSVEKIIIRAFITPGTDAECVTSGVGPPCYSASLEVRDSDGVVIQPDKLRVERNSVPSTPTENPFMIHTNNLTNNDVSISLDNGTGTAYVICTSLTSGLHVMKYNITTTDPVTGVCGSSNGGSFTSTPTTNLCSAGTPTSVTGSGPWNWDCTGAYGGTDATCSANLRVNGACGATLNACTTGALNDIADSSTNYLWNCTGSNGGTTASCSLPKPVNGVCGATNNACTTGTLNDIANSGTNYLWECTGSNGGTTASCSAPIPTGSVDLIVVSMTGISSSYEYGGSFNVNWSVRNQGTGPSGPFTVKLYQNGSKAMGGSLLFTESVSGLAAGASIGGTKSVATTAICSIHVYCYFNLWVDADYQVTESIETNNLKSTQSERAR